MSKWKCEICNTEFENFEARGFNNIIYCPLCYYKKLYNQQKEVLDKIKEYITTRTPSDIGISGNKPKKYYTLSEDEVEYILELLEEI